MIYSANKGNLYSKIRIFTLMLAMLALWALVPVCGVEAVLFVVITDMLMTRVWSAVVARRIGPVPFQDHWVVVGSLLTVACWFIERAIYLSSVERYAVVLSVSCTVLSALLLSIRIRLGPDWLCFLRGRKTLNFEETHV